LRPSLALRLRQVDASLTKFGRPWILDAAIHQPRVDASEGALVIGDVRLPTQAQEELRARFDYEKPRKPKTG